MLPLMDMLAVVVVGSVTFYLQNDVCVNLATLWLFKKISLKLICQGCTNRHYCIMTD